jgi:hypothetical protein
MFCIVDGDVRVAARGSSQSHSEWFRSEGWMTSETKAEFMESTIRGFLAEDRSAIHFYKGVGFYFNDDMVVNVIRLMPNIKRAMPEIRSETLIKFGPADEIINGVRFSSFTYGKFGG